VIEGFHEALEWWMAIMLHNKGRFDVYADVQVIDEFSGLM
jgi:hypothetical protein